jgi:hypothetical protein
VGRWILKAISFIGTSNEAMNKIKRENVVMTSQDVVEIVKLLTQHNIDVIIDGGWGADALLG